MRSGTSCRPSATAGASSIFGSFRRFDMDKTTTQNKLARNIESKRAITAETCPAKGEHRSYHGRTHPACGEVIPFGPFDPAAYARFIEVRPSATTESGTSAEVAALWSEYADAEAERARLAGEIAKAGRE